MKKTIKYILLSLVIAFSIAPGYTLSFDNLSSSRQPTGFRDVYWGAGTSDHLYLFQKSDNVDGIEAFGRECENLTLGSARFSEITYHFYNDRFFQVSMVLNNDRDHKSLLDTLIEIYGKPEKESGMHIWGNDTVEIVLFSNGAFIRYLPIIDKINHKNSNN